MLIGLLTYYFLLEFRWLIGTQFGFCVYLKETLSFSIPHTNKTSPSGIKRCLVWVSNNMDCWWFKMQFHSSLKQYITNVTFIAKSPSISLVHYIYIAKHPREHTQNTPDDKKEGQRTEEGIKTDFVCTWINVNCNRSDTRCDSFRHRQRFSM